jgi:hypothetical protein
LQLLCSPVALSEAFGWMRAVETAEATIWFILPIFSWHVCYVLCYVLFYVCLKRMHICVQHNVTIALMSA